MTRKKIAYLRESIDWNRPGIFDKAVILAMLEDYDVDVYLTNPPSKLPEYFENINLGDLRIIKLRNFGYNFLTSFFVFIKLKLIEDKYDLLLTDMTFFSIGNAMLDSPKSVIYYHSPERSFYDLFYFRYSFHKNFFRKMLQLLRVYPHRFLDNYILRKSKNVTILTNSNNTANRVCKYYGKYSNILYPCGAIRDNISPQKPDNFHLNKYYLFIANYTPNKRIEIAIESFNNLSNENLVIVGWGSNFNYINYLKKLAKGNIYFYSKMLDEELKYLIINSTAVIQTSLDEDFGMVPLDAMELGKPVIAVAEGGFLETIKDGETGLLFIQPYIENLVKIIKNFDSYLFNSEKIKFYIAEKFSFIVFKDKLKEIFNNIIKNNHDLG